MSTAAAAPYAQRLADLADDRRRGGDAGIKAVARRDADVHLVETVQALGHAPHGRRGEPRHRAGAADDADARGLGCGVECTDAGDEGARVGEIDVVAAGGDACTRQGVVLLLDLLI